VRAGIEAEFSGFGRERPLAAASAEAQLSSYSESIANQRHAVNSNIDVEPNLFFQVKELPTRINIYTQNLPL
jgi:hypothetical protein